MVLSRKGIQVVEIRLRSSARSEIEFFFSFGPGPNISIDRTESGSRPSKAYFGGPTLSIRSG